MRLTECWILGLTLWCAACGGSQKPAEEPASDAAPAGSEASASDDAAASASEGKPVEDGKDEASKADKDGGEASTSGPSIKRTPQDIVTAPDSIFMFSFNASDMKRGAEERCDARAKDDPKKRAECMTKEKEKIPADGMQFKQEKGKWYWLTLRRKGNTLINLHKVPVEFADETETTLVLKPVGKDEGTQPGKAPGETKIEVPNDYQIIVEDPKHGKMVYEAKLGLTGEQPR